LHNGHDSHERRYDAQDDGLSLDAGVKRPCLHGERRPIGERLSRIRISAMGRQVALTLDISN
jgi:hypothetical protein